MKGSFPPSQTFPASWFRSPNLFRRRKRKRRAENEAASRTLSPLLGLHMLFSHTQFENERFGKIHECIRTAGVKNGVRQIADMMPDPGRINASATMGPIVLWLRAG